MRQKPKTYIMKTVKQELESRLVKMGMFDTQAAEVMDLAIAQIEGLVKDYHITWDAEYSSYPEAIYNVLIISIKPIALKWIEENKPQAWFKEMFK